MTINLCNNSPNISRGKGMKFFNERPNGSPFVELAVYALIVFVVIALI